MEFRNRQTVSVISAGCVFGSYRLCFDYYCATMLNKRLINTLRNILSNNFKYFSTSNDKTPIISCKQKHFNFYGKTYGKNEEIPLASKGWYHRKSKGDYFIIHRGAKEVTPEVYSARSLNATGLSSIIVQAAERENILVPTNIQYKGIRKVLDGHHTMITAETGCGKTLAYLLPILDQIVNKKAQGDERPINSPLAVILTPSRELVTQIHDVAKQYCKLLNLDVRELVGGYTKKKMLNPAMRNVDLIVATPGIFSKFLTHQLISPRHLHHVVLDEADTLLDESFEYKLSGLLRKVKFRNDYTDFSKAQLTLVSATVPSDLPAHVSEFVDPDSIVKIVSKDAHKTLPNIPQRFLRIGNTQKAIELLTIARVAVHKKSPLMVFSNKSNTCDWISFFLNENGIRCVSVNGDMHVALRNGKYEQYNTGEVDVISCTDMLSRGMDTIRTRHVLNYDFPITTFDYIHRIGRTGRIGSGNGCHVTNFISTLQNVLLTQKIEMSIRKFADLPSVDGNTKKVLRNRSAHNVERAKKELMSVSG